MLERRNMMLNKKKVLLRLFIWPFAATIFLIIPKLNVILFGVGLSSLLIIGCFPWFLIQMLICYTEKSQKDKDAIKSILLRAFIAYIISSFPMAMIISYGRVMTHLYDPISNYWEIVFNIWTSLFFPFSFFLDWIL